MNQVKLPLAAVAMAAVTSMLALALFGLDLAGRPPDPVLTDSFRLALAGTMSTLTGTLLAQKVNGK